MTAFSDFPEIGTGLRLVGTSILDEEQYRVEEWHLYRNTEWRPTIAGIHAYAALRERRKSDRKSAWQQRQDADSENTDYINGLLDEAGK